MNAKRRFGMSMMIVLAFVSCASNKNQTIQNPTVPATITSGSKLIVPCYEESRSDKNYYRELGVGEDVDLEAARLKALQAANRMLRNRLGGVVKGISEDYVVNLSGSNDNMVQSRLEQRMSQAVEKALNDADNPCEEPYFTSDGTWQVYYVIEVSKSVVVDEIADVIKTDEELQEELNMMDFLERVKEKMRFNN